MEAILIAPARRGDSPRLAAMSRRLVEAGLEPCWTVERIERHRHSEDSVVLTARVAGTIGGFAIMQYGDDAAHLNLLAVEPAHQRQGIGRQLVGWLEETARVAGTFSVRLELRASNRVARAFYTVLGYRQSGWLRGYYQGVEDALRFERDLAVRSVAGAGKT
jgi:ribosomal protein S18 acetylase RimI-like enzyme